MLKLIIFGVILLMNLSCSSESEKPSIDIKVPLDSRNLVELSEELRNFGKTNDLFVLENDRDQMQVLDGGSPAISFWFSLTEHKTTAINVTTVNEGDFIRVMMFSAGLKNAEQMENVQNQFLEKFKK